MYELYKQGHAIYEQYKDWIIPIALVAGFLTRYFWDRIKAGAAGLRVGIKACWPSRKPVVLEGQSRDIVYNIMKAEHYDANGNIHLGNLLYLPDGTIKRRHFVDNALGDGFDVQYGEVPLEKHERKALKEVHKTKLAELKQKYGALLRTHAANPEKHASAMFLDGQPRMAMHPPTQRTNRKGSLIIVDDPMPPETRKS